MLISEANTTHTVSYVIAVVSFLTSFKSDIDMGLVIWPLVCFVTVLVCYVTVMFLCGSCSLLFDSHGLLCNSVMTGAF